MHIHLSIIFTPRAILGKEKHPQCKKKHWGHHEIGGTPLNKQPIVGVAVIVSQQVY